MKDFITIAAERYSVRKFSEKPIEQEKLDLVLKAGQLAPTAVNYQPQRILVLNNEAVLTKLEACTPYRFHAPLALLVCYDKKVCAQRKADGKYSGDIDASIVATHMLLEATDIGLGATWVMHFDPEKITKTYDLPEQIVPVALLVMGYPAQDATPSNMHEKRAPIEQTVFYHDFSSWSAPELDEAARANHR
jgi:Nitroreductase